MPAEYAVRRPVNGQAVRPAPRIYHRITSLEDLGRHLQWALCVELATIPPYLCALYSVTDVASEAYRLVRSVALEEMLHMMQVANLMNAIGASPSLAPEFVPSYPGYVPHHAAGGPFIQLQRLSRTLARTVFMPIEMPEVSPRAPAEGDQFHTIGQFYKAIERGFEDCVSRKYSEIVWLPMGRIASTSTNADTLTGLPNTYVSPATARSRFSATTVVFSTATPISAPAPAG